MNDAFTYRPYSGLGSLLRRHEEAMGADKEDRASADCAAVALADGLGVIGKLMLYCDTRNVAPLDWQTLGDFLVTQSEVLGSLLNIASQDPADLPGTTADAASATT